MKLITWHEKHPVLSVDCHSTSRRIATGGADNHIRIWQYHTVTDAHTDTHTNANSSSSSVEVKSCSSVEFLSTLSRHTLAVNVVRFSPNGQFFSSLSSSFVPSSRSLVPLLTCFFCLCPPRRTTCISWRWLA